MPAAARLPPLLGAVLIGGSSSRMGQPKHLLELGGETFVERIARTLESVVPELLISGEGVVPAALARHSRVPDLPGIGGPLAGLLAAMNFRPEAAWLAVACDQPLLSVASLRWLIGRRGPDLIAVLPRSSADRIQPFPGIYEPGCQAALRALAERAARQRSLQLLSRLDKVSTPVVPGFFMGAFFGANTPADLAEIARRARGARSTRSIRWKPVKRSAD